MVTFPFNEISNRENVNYEMDIDYDFDTKTWFGKIDDKIEIL